MTEPRNDSFPLSVWIPRALIGLSIVLLIYFTWITHLFKGTYDESFLAPENLGLVRGPLANEEYYRFGELDYKGKIPFVEELAGIETLPSATPSLSLPVTERAPSATEPEKP